MHTINRLKNVKGNTSSKIGAKLSCTGGLQRLAPAWPPRSFLQADLRVKLHPDDTHSLVTILQLEFYW